MKKVVIGIMIALIPAPALANDCPSGSCDVIINCSTGQVTYVDHVAQPIEQIARLEPVVPTHQIAVSSGNQSWGTAGTVEQITQAVQSLAPAPLTVDPCLNGGCTKVEINATTGVTTISPLSDQELKQRAKDQATESRNQAELAKAALQALPNIQPYVQPNRDTSIEATQQDESVLPDWWNEWIASWNQFIESYFWWWAA